MSARYVRRDGYYVRRSQAEPIRESPCGLLVAVLLQVALALVTIGGFTAGLIWWLVR